ncbi:hypothetical protein [Virgibacillus ainsalahensis]
MTTKEEVIQIIKSLPDSVSMEQIMHELYVHIKFQQGAQEMNNGKSEPKDKDTIKSKSGKWLH